MLKTCLNLTRKGPSLPPLLFVFYSKAVLPVCVVEVSSLVVAFTEALGGAGQVEGPEGELKHTVLVAPALWLPHASVIQVG